MKASNLGRLQSPTGWKSRTLTPTPVNSSAPTCNASTPTANPSENPSMPSRTAQPVRHRSWCRRPRTIRIGVVVPLASLLGDSDTPAELADRSGFIPGETLRQQIADALALGPR